MHHAALSIYLHSLLGTLQALWTVELLERFSCLVVSFDELYKRIGVVDPFGKPLQETCPADSHHIREIFSLEIVGQLGTAQMMERITRGVEFVNKVIDKGENRTIPSAHVI